MNSGRCEPLLCLRAAPDLPQSIEGLSHKAHPDQPRRIDIRPSSRAEL